MTAATSAEYWPWSISPWDRPNSAEIVPKVSPVDISRVVYIPSRCGEPYSWQTG
ncbi:hypothetical protein D3C81_1732360 [compost metagenome]